MQPSGTSANDRLHAITRDSRRNHGTVRQKSSLEIVRNIDLRRSPGGQTNVRASTFGRLGSRSLTSDLGADSLSAGAPENGCCPSNLHAARGESSVPPEAVHLFAAH